MLPLHFAKGEAHRVKEVSVRGNDRAVQFEFDHSLRAFDGGNLTLVFQILRSFFAAISDASAITFVGFPLESSTGI